MNLIDILKNILNTKIEIKDIIDENNNFSRYPISVHNYLAQKYNQGYIRGYSEKYFALKGVYSYPEEPMSMLDYEVDTSHYDSYTYDALVDIMRDVLNIRLNLKTELDTESDYFPSYPELLRFLMLNIEDTGYEQGEEDAEEVVEFGDEELLTPTLTFDDNVFTLYSSQEGVSIWYKVGEDGVGIRYTDPVRINDDVDIYYWSSYAGSRSPQGHTSLTYNSGGSQGEEEDKVYSPTISQKGNTITIKRENTGDTIYYNINDTGWRLYKTKFEITEDVEIVAYSVRGSGISPYISGSYKYKKPFIDDETGEVVYPDNPDYPDDEIDPDNPDLIIPAVPTCSQSQNTITLSCSTTGADIYYKIGSTGSWTLYSGSFNITDSVTVYAYSILNEIESTHTYFPLIFYVDPTAPAAPYFYEYSSGGVGIGSYTRDASIYYRYGYDGVWILGELDPDVHEVLLYPDEDTIICAYSLKDGLQSETKVYQYDFYSSTINLTAPVINVINNRVIITSDYQIFYTTDGSNPKENGVRYIKTGSFEGIPITETTVVKAIATDADENNNVHWSPISTKICQYIEEGLDYSLEYFTIKGASQITLSGVTTSSSVMSYSYDKVTWTPFTSSVTGLDTIKNIYLKGYNIQPYRLWDTMTFGPTDQVTISGNILSFNYPDSFIDHGNHSMNMLYHDMFLNNTSLVDAQNLYIPTSTCSGSDFIRMFKGCRNLKYGPKIRVNDLGTSSLEETFSGCNNLISIHDMVITSIGSRSLYRSFYGCSSLELFSKISISEIPNEGMLECFYGCSKLVYAELTIYNSIGYNGLKNAFYGCSSFTGEKDNTLTIYLNANNLSSSCCLSMFEGCSSMRRFGDLPAQIGQSSCYESMFKGCSNLKTFGNLGLTKVAPKCCMSMFEGCRSMETAPALKPTNIGLQYSYWRLFYGCSSLNFIEAHFLNDPLETGNSYPYTQDWVNGVAEYGTFVQDVDATWYRTGVSAIPTKWTLSEMPGSPGRITSISSKYDKVTITCSNDSDIYYRLNDDLGDEWTLYTGPFTLDYDSYVYARSKSSREIWGPISNALIEIEIPKLTISSKENKIVITSPDDYNYTTIYYRFVNDNYIGDWVVYSGPMDGDFNYKYIQAKGLKTNGTYGPITQTNMILNILPPVITNTNNIVNISTSMVEDPWSWGHIYIKYRLNDTISWSDFTSPFVITQDTDVEAKVVYTITSGSSPLSWESDTVNAHLLYNPNGASGILYTPVFYQKYPDQNPNIISMKYNGADYLPGTVKVYYKLNDGEYIEWESVSDMQVFAGQIIITEDTVITTYAEDENNNQSPVVSYSFTYDDTYTSITVPSPVINIVHQPYTWSQFDYLYISSSSQNAKHYIRTVGGGIIREWMEVQPGVYTQFYNQNDTNTFIIEAFSRYDIYQSSLTTKEFDPVSGESGVPSPTVLFDSNTNTIYINTPSGQEIFLSYDGVNFSSVGYGNYSFTISDDTTIWTYAKQGDEVSETVEYFFEYSNTIPSPSITYTTDPYVVTISNTDPDVDIYYKINNGSFIIYTTPFSANEGDTITSYASKTVSGQTKYSETITVTLIDAHDGIMRISTLGPNGESLTGSESGYVFISFRVEGTRTTAPNTSHNLYYRYSDNSAWTLITNFTNNGYWGTKNYEGNIHYIYNGYKYLPISLGESIQLLADTGVEWFTEMSSWNDTTIVSGLTRSIACSMINNNTQRIENNGNISSIVYNGSRINNDVIFKMTYPDYNKTLLFGSQYISGQGRVTKYKIDNNEWVSDISDQVGDYETSIAFGDTTINIYTSLGTAENLYPILLCWYYDIGDKYIIIEKLTQSF